VPHAVLRLIGLARPSAPRPEKEVLVDGIAWRRAARSHLCKKIRSVTRSWKGILDDSSNHRSILGTVSSTLYIAKG
jgi:hypothetical protein